MTTHMPHKRNKYIQIPIHELVVSKLAEQTIAMVMSSILAGLSTFILYENEFRKCLSCIIFILSLFKVNILESRKKSFTNILASILEFL